MIGTAPTPADAALTEAHALLARIRLIDGHNDMPYVMWKNAASKGDVRIWDARKLHLETDTDIPRLQEGMVSTQVLTAFIPSLIADPLRVRAEVIDTMLQLEQLYPDVFRPVLEPDDIPRAKEEGRIGLFKAVEGLAGIDKIAHLRLFHAMGIRLVTFCHNETLPFIDSATDRPGATPLSSFGAEIVAELERLGIILDLAHASADAQHAVIDVAKGPVIISHANARAICNHPRNTTDEVMKHLADKGGMIMATFVPAFLQQNVTDSFLHLTDGLGKMRHNVSGAAYAAAKKHAFALFVRDGAEVLIDHIEHMRNLIGPEAIGIGSDFYGGPNPPGLDDATCYPHLFATLIRRGWKTGDLEKLAGANFERVWRSVYRADVTMKA